MSAVKRGRIFMGEVREVCRSGLPATNFFLTVDRGSVRRESETDFPSIKPTWQIARHESIPPDPRDYPPHFFCIRQRWLAGRF